GGLGGGISGGGGGGLGGGGGGGLGGGGGGGLGGGGGGFFNVADQPESITIDESVPPQTFWNDYFAKHHPKQEVVRQTARAMIEGRKFDQVIPLTQAALQQGQGQAWMFETMGLAMQLDGRPKREIERAMMSAVDLSDSVDNLMYIAGYLARIGLDKRAVQLAQQVAKLESFRPDPYVLGLRIAERTGDDAAMQWATAGVLGQAWPHKQAHLKRKAMRHAKALLEQLRRSGKKDQAQAYQQQLDAAMVRDCVVRVSWTGEADIDLLVEEPNGTICSLREPRTSGGGVMLGDGYSRHDQSTSDANSEVYVCPRGFSGTYRVLLRRVWGSVTANRVTVDVYTNYRSKQMQHERQQIPLADDEAVVIFDLKQSRRQEPVAEEQIAHAVEKQKILNHAILAQQLSALSDPRVTPGQRAVPVGLTPLIAGSAVGFQPIIITLPEGTNFSVTGVISADRRYVRVTPTLIISSIPSVSTFTFAGTAQSTGGGGTNPPGGGNGGGNGGNGGGNGGGGDAGNLPAAN
ncbi:MAG: hypothetical protein ACC645_06150, partial [Pirellulales bacterium]